MNLDLLRQIRHQELQLAVEWLPPRGRILELGSGAGWQALVLEQLGFEVRALDVESSRYRDCRVFPVEHYDGETIPAETRSFDAVFSSNVLEHVREPRALQAEILRVLRPGGRAVHILPTGSWRFWTLLLHYPHTAGSRLRKLRSLAAREEHDRSTTRARLVAFRLFKLLAGIPRRLVPPRHGERGNCLTELWTFSRFHWRGFFQSEGWEVLHIQPASVYYSGYLLADRWLDLERRTKLSRLLGSSCCLYVLCPSSDRPPP